ncbi:aldo/keto reductase [Amycolatopsis sp. SID8362]|uniref:aldo/keto reductase n=1 Tax=Amycolatopsis sp. SID8362 TaxID=2690346 RepID=UPI002815BBAF|nr:aldo/keto reductase [Amycolatopsis sp. SID8362]
MRGPLTAPTRCRTRRDRGGRRSASSNRPPGQAADHHVVRAIARQHGATPAQVALAWLLHLSPNILLIPGTTSVTHLKDNLAADRLRLAPDEMRELNQVAATA